MLFECNIVRSWCRQWYFLHFFFHWQNKILYFSLLLQTYLFPFYSIAIIKNGFCYCFFILYHQLSYLFWIILNIFHFSILFPSLFVLQFIIAHYFYKLFIITIFTYHLISNIKSYSNQFQIFFTLFLTFSISSFISYLPNSQK